MSRVGSHTDRVTNATAPARVRLVPPVCHSSAMMIAATTRTPAPSTVSATAQARSGTLTRAGAAFGSRSGARSAVAMLLAGCKHGLPLDGDRLERAFHLLHQRRGQRTVVERRGVLLPVVQRPPEEVHQ